MRHYLKRLEGVDLKVILFSNNAKELNLKSGQSKALLTTIESITYDGASDFSHLNHSFAEQADYYIVFTDGLSTLGNIEQFQNEVPIYTVSPKQVSVNRPLLNALSVHGNHFTLEAKNSRKIARAIGSRIVVPFYC